MRRLLIKNVERNNVEILKHLSLKFAAVRLIMLSYNIMYTYVQISYSWFRAS